MEQQALAKWGLNHVIEEYLPRKLGEPGKLLPWLAGFGSEVLFELHLLRVSLGAPEGERRPAVGAERLVPRLLVTSHGHIGVADRAAEFGTHDASKIGAPAKELEG